MSLSKYDSLVGTGYIPTDAEMHEIKQGLSQPLSRMAQIEAIIAGYESEIEALRKEQDDLNHSIIKYRILISPMHRLPEDILREIFILCLPEDRNPTMSNDEAPMLLTCICSHWRSVALAVPGLWSSIHIAVPKSTPMYESIHNPSTGERVTVMQITERRAKAINEWLSRAGMLPLKISLHEWDVYPSTEYCKILVRCILPYMSRWKSLSITSTADSIGDIKAIRGSDTPILETIKLDLCRDKPSSPENWGPGCILSAPSVSQLSFKGIKGLAQLPVEWSNLTRLDLDGNMWDPQDHVSIANIMNILEQCHSLRSCRVYVGYDANTTNTAEFPPLSLPALESLWIYEGAPIPNFLNAWDVPALRKIEYYYNTRNCSLSNLLSCTDGGIEHLTIAPRAFTSAQLRRCLTQCPLLTTLSLAGSTHDRPMDHNQATPTAINDTLLESFAPPNPSDECLCPEMEVFECLTEAHFSEAALLDFIARKQSGADPRIKKLKSVSVAFKRPPVDKDITVALENYIADGLKVKITYPPAGYRGVFSLYDGIPRIEDPYYQHPIY